MEPINKNEEPQYPHSHYHPHHLFSSRWLRWGVGILSGLIILILVLALGINIGRHEERFTRDWAQNYPGNFGGPKSFSLQINPGDRPVQPHGLFGAVISKATDNKSIVVKGDRDVEKTVLLDDSTIIEKAMNTLKAADLKVNDSVIVIGEPNQQGQIDAKLIRVIN